MPADSPMPTPIRASASVVTLCAMPHKNVIALQNANAIATMLRRLSRSATRAIGNAEQRIEQHEAKTREQAHGGVAERELLFDRLDQDVEDGAVEEVQRVDDGQHAQHVIAPHRGLCGGIRLCSQPAARDRPLASPRNCFDERAAHASRMKFPASNSTGGCAFIERDADRDRGPRPWPRAGRSASAGSSGCRGRSGRNALRNAASPAPWPTCAS